MTQHQTIVHVVRHGAVDNPTHIYYGREYNFPLSATGRLEAATAGQALADRPIAAIFYSPLLRTTQTAFLIRSQLAPHQRSLPIHPHPNLIEVFSPFDGLTMAELEARDWDLYSGSPPPYEQPGDVLGRFHKFLTEARARFAGQEIVAVTHGDVVAFGLLWGLGQPTTSKRESRFLDLGLPDHYPVTASISSFVLHQLPPHLPQRVTYLNPHSL